MSNLHRLFRNFITGPSNAISGAKNLILGNASSVKGDMNIVNGESANMEGNYNTLSGTSLKAYGLRNLVMGSNCNAVGDNGIVSGQLIKNGYEFDYTYVNSDLYIEISGNQTSFFSIGDVLALGYSDNGVWTRYLKTLTAVLYTGGNTRLSWTIGGALLDDLVTLKAYNKTESENIAVLGKIIVPQGQPSISHEGKGRHSLHLAYERGTHIQGSIHLLPPTGNPEKPAEGAGVIWKSDGSGLGSDGDIMGASTEAGVTKYDTLFSYSAGTTWT